MSINIHTLCNLRYASRVLILRNDSLISFKEVSLLKGRSLNESDFLCGKKRESRKKSRPFTTVGLLLGAKKLPTPQNLRVVMKKAAKFDFYLHEKLIQFQCTTKVFNVKVFIGIYEALHRQPA